MNTFRAIHVLPGGRVSLLWLPPLYHGLLLSPRADIVDFGLCGYRTLRGIRTQGLSLVSVSIMSGSLSGTCRSQGD